jgi:type I restriction-modification system DNA methylase subunit
MRHFATQSGKSKGQFYTPAEVSRIIAKVIGISPENTVAATIGYDPTCVSGSLLLKVAAEAGKHITLEGQEKDSTTAGLARMNMILHDFPTANIASGGEGTLVKPRFSRWRAAANLRLRRRKSALLGQDLVHRADRRRKRRERPPQTLHLGRFRPRNRATMPTCCISSAA